jgi:hypothetical protein
MPISSSLLYTLQALILYRDLNALRSDNRGAEVMVRAPEAEDRVTHNP